jgi:hypothetical protein
MDLITNQNHKDRQLILDKDVDRPLSVVCPSVCRCNGARDLERYPYHLRVTKSHI